MTPTGPSGNGLKKKAGKKKRRRQARPGDTEAGDRASDGPVPRVGTLALCVDLTWASSGPSALSGASRSQGAGRAFRKALLTFPKFSLEPKGCDAPGGDSVGGVPQSRAILSQPQLSLSSAPGSLALCLLRFPPARQSHLNSAPQRTASW